jgi:GDPmannose 4,6-dehydratase
MFNHESPLRPLAYVSQKISYAAAAIALGMTETPAREESGRPIVSDGTLYLGDLGVRRDFGFAGDYVEAMHMLLQHSEPDDYIIGTGQSHSIQEFCEAAFRAAGCNWTEHVQIDPELYRKIDSRYTCADTTKLRNVYDWTPKTSFEELVAKMVSAQIRNLNGGDFVDAV